MSKRDELAETYKYEHGTCFISEHGFADGWDACEKELLRGNRVCPECGCCGDDVEKLEYGYKCKCGTAWASMEQLLEQRLASALAAVGHLREAIASGDKEKMDHALSATSGFEEKE